MVRKLTQSTDVKGRRDKAKKDSKARCTPTLVFKSRGSFPPCPPLARYVPPPSGGAPACSPSYLAQCGSRAHLAAPCSVVRPTPWRALAEQVGCLLLWCCVETVIGARTKREL